MSLQRLLTLEIDIILSIHDVAQAENLAGGPVLSSFKRRKMQNKERPCAEKYHIPASLHAGEEYVQHSRESLNIRMRDLESDLDVFYKVVAINNNNQWKEREFGMDILPRSLLTEHKEFLYGL